MEGRTQEDSSVLERFLKFEKITEQLKTENIELTDIRNGNPFLEDKNCGFKLIHSIIAWYAYSVEEVVEMIVKMRNDFIERCRLAKEI
jgi:hypothetical protein